MSYCIDTSGLIDAGVRYYPFENFPTLWVSIETLISNGRLIAPEIVLTELTVKDDATTKWAKRNSRLFLPMTAEMQKEAQSILEKHQGLVDVVRQRGAADPFVVAAAKIHGFAVVTAESRRTSPSRPWKIPDVCDALGIRCMRVLDLIKLENWVF